jgi:hypothetical protein
MEVSAKVLTAVADASKLMSVQLLRHGICDVLVQVCILNYRRRHKAVVVPVFHLMTDAMNITAHL